MKRPPLPPDLWFAEQLEAVAIAIAMALILKFFVIEAYQIPTGSMQPTILGDATSGIKDRVLADKLCTMLRAPRRWEVMIFRFPLDERRLYVKRIVGLPGETLEIKGGDVWIDGKIARKPDHVNDSVLKTVFPTGKDGGIDIGRAFSAGPGIAVSGEEARFAPDAGGELKLRTIVRAEYLHGYDPDWHIPALQNGVEAVPDLELACTVTLDPQAESLQLALTSDEGETRFTLPRAVPGSGVEIRFLPAGGGEPVTLYDAVAGSSGLGSPAGVIVTPAGPAAGLVPGTPTRVVARCVDRQVTLFVDGEVVARIDDDVSDARTDRPGTALAALAVRGGGLVQDVVLRRDIFYIPRARQPRWQIPDDCYFGLGDNTQGSLDGRGWNLKTLVLRDNTEISGFDFAPPREGPAPVDANPRLLPGNRLVFADVHGDERILDRADIIGERLEPAPFINERYILGKAIAVFWPVFDPFRWKLIR